MFISNAKRSYHARGQGIKGKYLCIFYEDVPWGSPNHMRNPRAVIRSTTLSQLGHFMMGTIVVGSYRISVSGECGSDGLWKTVPSAVYQQGLPLPDDLVALCNKDTTHNGLGSEQREALREWAWANLDALTAFNAKIKIPTQYPDYDSTGGGYRYTLSVNHQYVSAVSIELTLVTSLVREDVCHFRFTTVDHLCIREDRATLNYADEQVVVLSDAAITHLYDHGWGYIDDGTTADFTFQQGYWVPPRDVAWRWLAIYCNPRVYTQKLIDAGYTTVQGIWRKA